MFTWFTNLKVSARVFAAALLPIVILVAFTAISMIEKYNTTNELERVGNLARFAPIVSALVHELQKERGQSAGFAGSKGKSFSDTLPTQRSTTNKTRQSFLAESKSFDYGAYDNKLRQSAEHAVEQVAKLDAMRSRIDSLQATVPQLAKYYTGTIASLLRIGDEMLRASQDDVVSKKIGAYLSFLQGKERAGRERAMGAGGFSAGKFQPKAYNNFVQLISAQNIFFNDFKNYGSDAEWSFYEKTLTGEPVSEVARMRKIAVAFPQTGTLDNVKSTHWYQQITAKINLMKIVEDRIATNLQSVAGDRENAAWNVFLLYAIATAIILGITGLLVTAIIRSITGPVADLTSVMAELADGNNEVEIRGLTRKDEIGSMAAAVDVFKTNAIERGKLEAGQRESQEQREARTKRMEEITAAFDEQAMEIVSTVATAATEMQATAESMSKTADETSKQASAVAAASEQATANVQTVASASEEMSASISEINRQVAQSSQIANKANSEAERTNETVQGLATAAQKIGEVVSLISEIAEQTNLLALNATIEAARAGEAGKGFAVVASEVKNLATQTAKATEDIGDQVAEMQSVTNDAVGAIRLIAETIGEINTTAETISSAMGEQGAATQEIAENTQQAATGTQEVTSNITNVTQAASETGASAQQVLGAAGELSQQSDMLRSVVEQFLNDVRAA